MDVTETIQENLKNDAKLAAKMAAKGIVLIVEEFKDRDKFMASLNEIAEDKTAEKNEKMFNKTGDIEYSYANVSVEELRKEGFKTEMVDEPVLKEAMTYFDKYCREYDIKYSALKTMYKGGDGIEREGYKVFFQGRDDKLIMDIIKNAYKDWRKDQEKIKSMGEAGKDAVNMEKPSVLAKLAFFRNRVKEFVSNEASKDKTINKERQREAFDR